ncbi:WXG100-like domain-containing protein [Streptomyces sp. NPDC001493]
MAEYDVSHIRDLGNQWLENSRNLYGYLDTMHGSVYAMAGGWTGKAGQAAQVVWNGAGTGEHNIWNEIFQAAWVAEQIGDAVNSYADELQKTIEQINKQHLIDALAAIFGLVLGGLTLGLAGVMEELASAVGQLVTKLATGAKYIGFAAEGLGNAAAFLTEAIMNVAVTLGTDLYSQTLAADIVGEPPRIDWSGEGLNVGLAVWAGFGMHAGEHFMPEGPNVKVPKVSPAASGEAVPNVSPHVTVPSTASADVGGLHVPSVVDTLIPKAGDFTSADLNSVVRTDHAPLPASGAKGPVTDVPRSDTGIKGTTAPLPAGLHPGAGGPGRTSGSTAATTTVTESGGPNPPVRQATTTTTGGDGARPPAVVRGGDAASETPNTTVRGGTDPSSGAPNTVKGTTAPVADKGTTAPVAGKDTAPVSGRPNAFLDSPPRTTVASGDHPAATTPASHGTGGEGGGLNGTGATAGSGEVPKAGGVPARPGTETATAAPQGTPAAHGGGARQDAGPTSTPPEPTPGPGTPARTTDSPEVPGAVRDVPQNVRPAAGAHRPATKPESGPEGTAGAGAEDTRWETSAASPSPDGPGRTGDGAHAASASGTPATRPHDIGSGSTSGRASGGTSGRTSAGSEATGGPARTATAADHAHAGREGTHAGHEGAHAGHDAGRAAEHPHSTPARDDASGAGAGAETPGHHSAQSVHADSDGPTRAEQWDSFKQRQTDHNRPLVEAESRLDHHRESLDQAWQEGYETFRRHDALDGRTVPKDGFGADNARWQWRNDITHSFRAEIERKGFVSGEAHEHIVADAKAAVHKYLIRTEQLDRFASHFKQQVERFRDVRGDFDELPAFEPPAKYVWDKGLQTYVKDDSKVYGHPADASGKRPGSVGTGADDEVPVDHFRDKTHDFNPLEQYYIAKREELIQIFDGYLHDADSTGGLPPGTGARIDALGKDLLEDFGGQSDREHDIREATEESFEDTLHSMTLGNHLPDDAVHQVRLEFRRVVRGLHDIVFRDGDGSGPRNLWREMTGMTADKLAPRLIDRELFVRSKLSEETEYAHSQLSDLGKDYLKKFGEDGQHRVVAEYLDVVRTNAKQHFFQKYDSRREELPAKEWNDVRDQVRSTLPDRIRYEGDLQALTGESAHQFHEIVGHGSDLVGHTPLHEDTMHRLGDDFRTQRVVRHDELFAPEGHRTEAWLAHESHHEDGFRTRVDDLQNAEYFADFPDAVYPAFKDWRAEPPTTPGEHSPGSPDQPVAPSRPAAPDDDVHGTTDTAPVTDPATPADPTPQQEGQIQSQQHEQHEGHSQAHAQQHEQQEGRPQGAQEHEPHGAEHQTQQLVIAERETTAFPGAADHTSVGAVHVREPETRAGTRQENHDAVRESRQDTAGTLDARDEVHRLVRRTSEFAFTGAQIDHARQELLQERPAVADLPAAVQAALVGDALVRPELALTSKVTHLVLERTGDYLDSRYIHQVHQQLTRQSPGEFERLTGEQKADAVAAHVLDQKALTHEVRELATTFEADDAHVAYAHGELVEEHGSGFASLDLKTRAALVARNMRGQTPPTSHVDTQQAQPTQPTQPTQTRADGGKGKEADRPEFLEGSSSGAVRHEDVRGGGEDAFAAAVVEAYADEPALRGLPTDVVREAFGMQQIADPPIPGLRSAERLRDLASIGQELHRSGAPAAEALAKRLAVDGGRAGAFAGSGKAAALSHTGDHAGVSAMTTGGSPEALLTTGPTNFLQSSVVSMDMLKGLEKHAPGLDARTRTGLTQALDLMPGQAGHLPEHRFVLVRTGTETSGKPVFALTPAAEWYVQRYGAERFGIPPEATLPAVRAENGYVNAAFVPYLTRSAAEFTTSVGHVDVERVPVGTAPRLVVTPTMNGCAYAVTAAETGPERMTVWHYQSPDSHMPHPVGFRRERQPTDWFGAGEYYGSLEEGKLFEVANLMWFGPEGWEFVSQENHTHSRDESVVTLAKVRHRQAVTEPGHEALHTARAYQSLARSEINDWDLSQAERKIRAVVPVGADGLYLNAVHLLIKNHIENEIGRLGQVGSLDELRGLSAVFRAERKELASHLELKIAKGAGAASDEATSRALREAISTRRDLAMGMVDRFANRPAKGWIDQLRSEGAPAHPKSLAALYADKARDELTSPSSTVNHKIHALRSEKFPNAVQKWAHEHIERVGAEIRREIEELGQDLDAVALKKLAADMQERRDTMTVTGQDTLPPKHAPRAVALVEDMLKALAEPKMDEWLKSLRQDADRLVARSAWQSLSGADREHLRQTVENLLPAGSDQDGYFGLRLQRAYDGLGEDLLRQPVEHRAHAVADSMYGGERAADVDDFFVRSVNSGLNAKGRESVSAWRVHQAYGHLLRSREATFARAGSVEKQRAVADHLAGLGRGHLPAGSPAAQASSTQQHGTDSTSGTVEAPDLLDPEQFRAHTTDPAATGLRSLSRLADLDRMLSEYRRTDAHDPARRADALGALAVRARAYASGTGSAYGRENVLLLADQAESLAGTYRRQAGGQEPADAQELAGVQAQEQAAAEGASGTAGRSATVPVQAGPLRYRDRIALAKREWRGTVTDEVRRLERTLLDAGPGARSLVIGVAPGEHLWAVNVAGEVRWLEPDTARITQAPRSARATVVSIDLDPRARLIQPDPRLLATGEEASRFCELTLGGDLRHVV